MKRFFCLLTSLALLICLIPVTKASAYNLGEPDKPSIISSNMFTAYVIDENGTLMAWGTNIPADGKVISSTVPVKVMENVSSVVCCDYGLTLAIKADGALWGWGYDDWLAEAGSVFVEDAVYPKDLIEPRGVGLPVKIMDSVSAATVGYDFCAIIRSDGTLWTWGFNGSGQLGIGTTESSNTPVKILDNVESCSAGAGTLAAVTKDGSLWMCGWLNDTLSPTKVMTDVKSVSMGNNFCLTVKTDGTLLAWGWNVYGQLGSEPNYESMIPCQNAVKVMEDVSAAYAGYNYAMAVKTDGTLWVWGDNTASQLGTGGKYDITATGFDPDIVYDYPAKVQPYPVKILDNIEYASSACSFSNVYQTGFGTPGAGSVALHSAQSLAVAADGTVYSWGHDSFGGLGLGNSEQQEYYTVGSLPTAIPSIKAKVPNESEEYEYDTADPGADVVLPAENLEDVNSQDSAVDAVKHLVAGMTQEQKQSPTGIDLATLFAETAAAKAASKQVTGSDILINAAAVSDLQKVAEQTSAAVESALIDGGIATARYLSKTVTLVTQETGKISFRIDPDILTTGIDRVRIETPTYAVTFKLEDLAPSLTQVLYFSAESAAGGSDSSAAVNWTSAGTGVPAILSLPAFGSTDTLTIATSAGEAKASKLNPATAMIDGRIDSTGKYALQTNVKDFTDISSKSTEMQNAIRYLATRGIISGTTATTFSPNQSISRAEVAALLVRALGKLDNSATTSFSDVSRGAWYYSAAASSQKQGLISGYPDNTFRGTTVIPKDQIVTVAGRVLQSEMKYKAPANPETYLAKYKDTVASWAKPMVALATRENLVVYRYDGTFQGTRNMNRGDAAIIIYRLFQRIW